NELGVVAVFSRQDCLFVSKKSAAGSPNPCLKQKTATVMPSGDFTDFSSAVFLGPPESISDGGTKECALGLRDQAQIEYALLEVLIHGRSLGPRVLRPAAFPSECK